MDIDPSDLSTILVLLSCLLFSGPAFLIVVVILFYYYMKDIIGKRLRLLDRSRRDSI